MSRIISNADEILSQLKEEVDLFSAGLIHAAMGNSDCATDLLLSLDHWGDWEAISIHQLYPNILAPLKRDDQHKEILKNAHQSRCLKNE